MSKERIEKLKQRLEAERLRKREQREAAMKREQSTDCSICHLPLDDPWGNNAWPVNDGRCCDECNASVVTMIRLKMIYGSQTRAFISIPKQEGIER